MQERGGRYEHGFHQTTQLPQEDLLPEAPWVQPWATRNACVQHSSSVDSAKTDGNHLEWRSKMPLLWRTWEWRPVLSTVARLGTLSMPQAGQRRARSTG